MLSATTIPLDPPYIVPQIYCTGSSPSKFKLKLGEFTKYSDIFHEEFSKIPSWTLPGIAGVSFFAARTCWTIFAKISQIEWMNHPKTVLQALCVLLIVLPITLVIGTFALTGLTSLYLGARRMVLRYCDNNKPSDEEYQLYLEKLVNFTKLNEDTTLHLIRNTYKQYSLNNPILEATTGAFFQKFLEKLLELPDFKIPILLQYNYRISLSTQNAIYKKLADRVSSIDSAKTIYLIDAIYYPALDYELQKENKAQIFKQYAENELAVIPNHSALLTSLQQVGLNADLSQFIIAYTDTETNERIYRIRRYTEKTLYKKNDILITGIFFVSPQKVMAEKFCLNFERQSLTIP